MAARSTRRRRTRSNDSATVEQEAEQPDSEPQGSNGAKTGEKLPSHLTHHRMIARNLNALVENHGELRKQVVQIEREHKNTDKDLDARLFQASTQLKALEKKFDNFVEEMTEIAFEAQLKMRASTDQIDALWEGLEASGHDAEAIKRLRAEAVTRAEKREAHADEHLRELVEEMQRTKAPPAKPPSNSARMEKAK